MAATIKPITSADHDQLARFLAAFPGDGRDYAHWRDRLNLWWRDNPAATGDFPRGWLLMEGERLVGSLGNIPTTMLVAGRETTVMNATAWRVLPEYRQQSLPLFFGLMSAAQQTVLFCTTPNPTALEILRGLKFRPVPRSERAYHVRLSFTRPLELRLGLLGRLLSIPPNLVQRARLGLMTLPRRLKVSPVSRAGAEFDELWANTRVLYPTTNLRTAAVLNWRTQGRPDLGKTILAAHEGRKLWGYAVLRQIGEPVDQGLECLDLWADPAKPAAFRALVRWSVLHGLRQGLDLVIFHPFSRPLERALDQVRLGRFKDAPRNHFYLARGQACEAMEGPAMLCCLQGDVGL
jgi:hypothetical protein